MSWLRVVAIVGVVTIHVVGGTALMEGARQTWRGWLAIVLDIGAVFTVPVFVMASGALLLDPSRFRGTADFLRRRAVRLLPAVAFWHLFYWAFRVAYLDQDDSVRDFVQRTLTGTLYPHLYFFWIVLGLAVVTPVLIPWLATASPRAVLIAGVCAAAMPILTVSARLLLGLTPVWVDTPWTWWVLYLGFYLLGWGLRDVVLSGAWLWTAVLATVALGLGLSWQWRNPAAPPWLQHAAPISYYGLTVHIYSVMVFLLVRSLVRADGPLRMLARPRPAALGRKLGDATLGVFALHIAFVPVVIDLPLIGGESAAASWEQLLARVAVVLVLSFAVVLPLRRVPVIRRVL